jgi:hypothetical protein
MNLYSSKASLPDIASGDLGISFQLLMIGIGSDPYVEVAGLSCVCGKGHFDLRKMVGVAIT